MEARAGKKQLKIGIVGAGFSGTILAANLHRLSKTPIDIILCEKTNTFGTGIAYGTNAPFHLLNVVAKEMSAFPDDQEHFVNWVLQQSITSEDNQHSLADQFLPRSLYGAYLQELLTNIQKNSTQTRLHLISNEVVDLIHECEKIRMIFKDGRTELVDKVVLAVGNNLPRSMADMIPKPINYIHNPWDNAIFNTINPLENVLIVGSGLSMVDIVLNLYYQQHQGKIYVVSRHGLLPLPHHHNKTKYAIDDQYIPCDMRQLSKYIRQQSKLVIKDYQHWQPLINALRVHIPSLWDKINIEGKKQFLRHLLPYWNIHRHRLPAKTANLLNHLFESNQLALIAGRIIGITNDIVNIKLRQQEKIRQLQVNCIINCMGPNIKVDQQQPLLQSLIKKEMATIDPLNLGLNITSEGAVLATSGKPSSSLYVLGSLAKGKFWECTAVPQIRHHCFNLAKTLLNFTS